jgi:23S rRNA maturation-related 3'-5' exoribonuclease YhaM
MNNDYAKRIAEAVREAAAAQSNLTTFGQVVMMMEGGSMYGDVPAARRITKICNEEMQRQLKKYDAALAKVEKAAAPTEGKP